MSEEQILGWAMFFCGMAFGAALTTLVILLA